MVDPSDTDVAAAVDEPGVGRREARAFVELLAMTGLAITQPVFDIFGRAPDQFIFRGAGRGDIVLFALIVLLVPAVLLHVVEFVVGLVSAAARRHVHRVVIGGLMAVFASLLLDGFLPRLPALGLGLVVGVLFAFAHARTRGPRIWLAFLSPAPIVFALLFLFASPVSSLLQGPASVLGVTVRDPDPTVVVLFDELPLVTLLDEDGDVDADLFPNFARLAEQSDWFRQTTTVSNFTWLAAPAMLTGNLPREGTNPDSFSHPENLFTLVGGSMPITSSEVVSALCPVDVCEKIDADTGGLRALLGDVRRALTHRLSPGDPDIDPMAQLVEEHDFVPAAAEGHGEFDVMDADRGQGRFGSFVDRLGTDEAGLHFIHLLLPHSPYRILPDGTAYDSPELLGRYLDGWIEQVEPVRVARQQYLLQLQWTDVLLGRIIDRLEEAGTWDDTNLVVTADHGYGFEPGQTLRGKEGWNAEDDRTIAEILWVPFFVKAAGQTEGTISDDPVRTVDLLPTIADLLDVDVPWEPDGRSAFRGGSGDPDEAGLFLTHIDGDRVDPGPWRVVERARALELLEDRRTGLFATADGGVTGSDRIYRIGPRPELWGEPVPDDLDDLDVDIRPDSRADDLDLANGPPPLLFEADAPASTVGEEVAVAVNGTVWATTTVYDADGATITALLPPAAFRDGANTITVHVVP